MFYELLTDHEISYFCQQVIQEQTAGIHTKNWTLEASDNSRHQRLMFGDQVWFTVGSSHPEGVGRV